VTCTADLELRRQEVARLRREGIAIKDIAEQLGSTTTIRHDLDRVPPRPAGGPDDEHELDYPLVVVTPPVAARIAPLLMRALRAALADRQRVAEDVIRRSTPSTGWAGGTGGVSSRGDADT
jgi:hypothetical protein